MINALAALLLAAAGGAPAGRPAAPVIRYEEPNDPKAPLRLATPKDVARLCRRLEPSERLRSKGDAVERGQAEARHEVERDEAIEARYEVEAPAAQLAFAPYDGPEQRLELMEPATLTVGGGAARLWVTEDRGLPVEADAPTARRILEAQRAGTLVLGIVFDLPDDATCTGGGPGQRFTIPAEPVAWRWISRGVVIARGGEGSDRPLLTAAQGARPHVQVGEPIAGPSDMKKLVVSHAPELVACYAAALERDPALEGVLVADLGGARAVIGADSVGDPALAGCVQQVLSTIAAVRGGARVAVPIRFELVPPGTASAASTSAAGSPASEAAPAPAAAPAVER
jgi:hypothetical protein